MKHELKKKAKELKFFKTIQYSIEKKIDLGTGE